MLFQTTWSVPTTTTKVLPAMVHIESSLKNFKFAWILAVITCSSVGFTIFSPTIAQSNPPQHFWYRWNQSGRYLRWMFCHKLQFSRSGSSWMGFSRLFANSESGISTLTFEILGTGYADIVCALFGGFWKWTKRPQWRQTIWLSRDSSSVWGFISRTTSPLRFINLKDALCSPTRSIRSHSSVQVTWKSTYLELARRGIVGGTES